MIRHIALFKGTEETHPGDIAAIAAGLSALPAAIPAIGTYAFGPNIGANADNYDFAVNATFATLADYTTYVEHPAHHEVVVNLVRPHIAQRASLQFEWEES